MFHTILFVDVWWYSYNLPNLCFPFWNQLFQSINKCQRKTLYQLNQLFICPSSISGGELFERVVADDFTLTEKDCILFTRQICEGVDYMHKQNVVHLDLKVYNIFESPISRFPGSCIVFVVVRLGKSIRACTILYLGIKLIERYKELIFCYTITA